MAKLVTNNGVYNLIKKYEGRMHVGDDFPEKKIEKIERFYRKKFAGNPNFINTEEERGAKIHLPINLVIKTGSVRLFKIMVEELGADYKKIGSQHDETPLHYASHRGAYLICDYIIKKYKAENIAQEDFLETKSGFGFTPFIYAINANHKKTAWLLSDAGANQDAVANHGNNVLHKAIGYNQEDEMIRFLLFVRVSPYHKNELGYTPLDKALEQKDSHAYNAIKKECSYYEWARANTQYFIRDRWYHRTETAIYTLGAAMIIAVAALAILEVKSNFSVSSQIASKVSDTFTSSIAKISDVIMQR